MNIVLLGYRGSGKSSIGKLMADQLWEKFIDTDTEICKRFNNKTIKQIWDDHGEPAFREMECTVIQEALAKDDQIIALGGGAPIQTNTRQVILNATNAKRIYLKCDPTELAKRIHADTNTANNRPNLTSLGGGVEEIEKVLAERGPIYESVADITFDVTQLNQKDALKYIIKDFL